VYNLWTSSAVWAGLVAGIHAELLGKQRFRPLGALVLGVGIDLVVVYLTAIAGVPPGVFFLIPNLLLSGVAVPAVALMMRSVQAEAARRKAEATELALAQAELRALRAQINPHFLFNALNTIRYFVRTDPRTARRLLLNLSEVFQRALRSGEFVPLQDELSYVEAYLALEQARLDQRLRVEWSPPVAALRESPLGEHPVPTLILQPIVENAVVHGVAKKPEGGTVRVQVGQADGGLLLRVVDDGPGMAPERLAEVLDPGWPGKSIGLRNVDGRLRALYGAVHGLAVQSQVGQGTTVLIKIPLE
jgi:LytS/YehU family sensor histidine kinase